MIFLNQNVLIFSLCFHGTVKKKKKKKKIFMLIRMNRLMSQSPLFSLHRDTFLEFYFFRLITYQWTKLETWKDIYFWLEGIWYSYAHYKDLMILNIGFEIFQLEVGYRRQENQGYHLHRMRQNGRFHNCLGFLLPEEFHASRPYTPLI